MAQTIKLKRSAVSGNTPSTSDLELGEIAINTYDGKVFIKKDDGSASVIEVGAADNTKLPLAGGTMTGALNMGGNSISNVGSFTIDDVNFNGSSLTDAGNFTMDIGGDLTIDVDGADILLKDDGTEFGRFSRVTSDFVIKASASDQDLVFKGVDGASTITALTLDMSNEGTAKFNHDIELLDSSKAIFGTDDDLRIQHTGSHGYITNFTGHLVFSNESDDKQIQFKTDDGSGGSAVYVVVDGASENTKFFKNTRHNDSVRANFGTSDDLQIYHDTSDSYIKNNTGDLILDAANNIVLDADGGSISFKDGGVTKGQIQNSSDDLVIKVNTQDKDLKLQGNDGGSLITALTLDMSEGGNATFANNVTISGNLEVTGTTTQTGSIITNSNFTGLSDANSANATDFGFYGKYVESSTTKYAGMYYDASVDNTFKLFCDTQTAPTTTVNESATGYALANLNIAGLTTTGNVGIGIANTTAPLVVQSQSNAVGINLVGRTSDSIGELNFAASNGTNQSSIQSRTTDLRIKTLQSIPLTFHTVNTERMRLDPSGNLLVGKTSSSTSTAGFEARSNGQTVATFDGGTALIANRKTSDGDVIKVMKDGSTVGTIGADGGDMRLGTGITGLIFNDANNAILPYRTNAEDDGNIDIGLSSFRFRNLHLSGSANIGTNILMSNATTSAFMQVSSNILQFGTSSSDPLAFFTNNAEQIRIDTDGRLLLNTTSSIDDLSQLHIVGFTSGRAGITLQDGDSSTQKTFLTQSSGTTRFNTQNGTSYGSFQIGGWNGTTSADFVRVDSSGRVGIGTTAPSRNLHVQSAGSAPCAVFGNSAHNNSIEITRTTSAASYIALQAYSSTGGLVGGPTLTFSTANSGGGAVAERMRILSSGNVGIGTTSPTSTLEVAGTVRTDLIQTRDLSTMTFIDLDMDTGGTVGTNNMVFGAVSNMEFLVDTNNNGTGGAFIFKRDSNVPSSATEIMRLTESGNLGIGTDSPDSKVTIYNAATGITGLVKLWTNTSNNTAADGGAIEWVGSGDKTAIGSKIAATRVAGGGKMDLRFYTGRNSDANHEKMRILTDGTVGIGTIAPSGAKLHVAGGVKATDLIAHDSTGINLQTDEGTKRLVVADSGVITFNQAYSFPTSDGSTGQALVTDGSGNITFGSVSAGAASSMVDADGDTKIQVEEASDDDVIRFDTAGSERMIITDDGKVGINNNSPSKTLSVGGTFQSTGEAFFSHFDNFSSSSRMRDNLRLNFGTARTFAIIGNSTNMHIRNSSADIMTFDTNNNVGIGTSSPQALLHVSHATAPNFRLSRTGTGQIYQMGIDSSGRFLIQEAASEGGTKYTRFVIDDTGEVGIGTGAPDRKLHLYGTGGTVAVKAEAGDTSQASLDLRNSNSWFRLIAASGTLSVYDQADTTERFRIDTSGNVGIGTTSPEGNLHIKSINNVGDATLIVEADADNNVEGDNPRIEMRQDGNNVAGYLYIEGEIGQTATGTLANTTVLESKGTLNGQGIQFVTGGRAPAQSGGAANGNVRMTILGGGNVGIGTSSPSKKLTVDGDVKVGNGDAFMSQNVAGSPRSLISLGTDNILRIKGNDSEGSANVISMINGGNVGIGTTNPSEKLEVNGGNIRINNASGGSYFKAVQTSNNANAGYYMASGSSNWYTLVDVAGKYQIYDGDAVATRVIVDGSGNVGIGTTAPDSTLDVHGNTHLGSNNIGAQYTTTLSGFSVTANGSDYYGSYGSLILNSNQNYTSSSRPYMITNALGANKFAIISGTDATTDPTIGTGGAVTSGSVRLVIDNAGNVGIGNDSPNKKVHVVFSGDNGLNIDSTDNHSSLYVTSGQGYGQYIRFSDDSANYWINADTNGRLNFRPAGTTTASNWVVFDSNGSVGIGTSSLTNKFHVNGNARIEGNLMAGGAATSNVPARPIHVKSAGDAAAIRIEDTTSSNLAYDIRSTFNTGLLFVDVTNGSTRMTIADDGNVGIGTTSPGAKLQVEDAGIDTTTTTTSATTQVAIDTFAAATFRSAEFTIQVKNSTGTNTYHLTKVLLIHDGTTPAITEYGTIFTGSAAEATFDADISSGNVRLLATPASTDNMTFKVVRHCITV